MANKTFLQLQASCSSLWGFENPADLVAQDLVDIKDFINSAYLEAYAPIDGTRAWWSVKAESVFLKAPVTATVTVTQGSKTIAGYAFEAAYIGSFVRIGDYYLRYASATELVQHFPGTSGTYQAVVYHNAAALPWHVIETAGQPSIPGLGLLAPLPDADAELTLRTSPAFDFTPKFSRSPFSRDRRTFQEMQYFDTGEPRFYHIDEASVTTTFAASSRFHVYPINEVAYTVDLRANILPTSLSADADVPVMPHQTVAEVLLPLCREKVANNSAGRRFTGNPQLIAKEADRARATLKSFARTQRDTGGAIRMKPGW